MSPPVFDQELRLGAAVFRFPAGQPPRGLAAVLAGKPAPRARRKACPQLLALYEGQERAYENAMRSGSWAPAPPADLTVPRADAIVVALNTHRRYRGPNQEVHHMSNTTAKRTTATKAKPRKRAKAASTAKRTSSTPTPAKRQGITAMQAAEQVLRQATGPMKVSEIASAAVKLRAFKPTSKTPEASVAARVHVSAKTPGGVFVRVDRGVVDLRELNPRAKANRPAAPAPEQVAA